jgi:hypothetical protein
MVDQSFVEPEYVSKSLSGYPILDVAPDALEVPGALAVSDTNDVLVDDRAVVELRGHVVGRSPRSA